MTPMLCWIAAVLFAHAPADAPAATAGPLADLRPMEVRIRKLYLVRPDLLQYPNPYDVVC